jgi:hypothetical protein
LHPNAEGVVKASILEDLEKSLNVEIGEDRCEYRGRKMQSDCLGALARMYTKSRVMHSG